MWMILAVITMFSWGIVATACGVHAAAASTGLTTTIALVASLIPVTGAVFFAVARLFKQAPRMLIVQRVATGTIWGVYAHGTEIADFLATHRKSEAFYVHEVVDGQVRHTDMFQGTRP